MKKLALDAFGTLLTYTRQRINLYSRLVDSRGEKVARHFFLTRNVSLDVFADELGLNHLLPVIQHEQAEEMAAICLFSDVNETLRRLRGEGCQIVVCSNLAQPYGEVVKRLLPGLDGYVFSFEVGAKKPDAAIYQAVCDALDCVPSDVLFVGDSKRPDFDGPLAFGMQARLINRKAGQTLDEVLR